MITAAALAAARSLLFVPGHRRDRFDRAVASGADVVIIDLEDAVADQRKDEAREYARHWLTSGGHDAMVRINAVGTAWHDQDVAMAAAAGCAVLLPKAESAADVERLSGRLPDGVPVVPLIETAAGVVRAAEICAASRVVRPAFGSVDLAAQLGIDHRSREALRHARCTIVVAAAAARCAAPVDGVTTDVTDQAALRADIAHAISLGFTAKLSVHPRQVVAVNESFAPSARDIAWAREVLRHASDGSVAVFNGQMIDKPVLLRARAMLARSDETEE